MSPIRVLPMPFRRTEMTFTEQPSTFMVPTGADIQETQSAVSQVAGTPQGIIPLQFGLHNMAASLSNFQLWRVMPGSVADTHQTPVLMPFQGSVVGLSVMAHATKTAGTATFKVYKNGVLLSVGGEIAQYSLPNAQYGFQLWPGGSLWFAAGDRLDVRVSTSSDLAPAPTLDVEVMLLVIQTEEL